MKFIINSGALKRQLSALNGVITTNPVVPILENFLFEVNNSVLTVTASDMQTSMIMEIAVDSKEKGSVAVPAKKLIETLSYLPDQPLAFSIDESTYSIAMSADNGNYKLAGENSDDFPKMPQVNNDFHAVLSSEVLTSAINTTIFAASTEEIRPAITGVYINLGENNTTFAATDGHRLVRYRRADVKSEKGSSIIMPRKALMLLKSTLPQENTDVVIDFNSSNALFQFENVRMICRLIDEKYPDYENVIPTQNPIKVIINRAEFLTSLRLAAIYASHTTHQVKVKITGNEMQVSAEDVDFSNEADGRLSCEHEGEDIEMGFNAKLLIELLNNMTANEIKINLSVPSKAGVIVPTEKIKDEELLMLIMPVMINQYT